MDDGENCHKKQLEPAVDQLISDLQGFAIHPTTKDVKYLISISNNLALPGLLCPLIHIYNLEFVRSQVYYKWMGFVKTGGDMDVKDKVYRLNFGDPMLMFNKHWTTQLSGNLLYGFIGKYVGFTEVELYEGGGVGQYGQHCMKLPQTPDDMGPGVYGCLPISPIPHTWDQLSDQAQIEAGVILYNRYSSLFLAPGNYSEKRKRLAEVLLPLYDRINGPTR
jgi:hypothetical protein